MVVMSFPLALLNRPVLSEPAGLNEGGDGGGEAIDSRQVFIPIAAKGVGAETIGGASLHGVTPIKVMRKK